MRASACELASAFRSRCLTIDAVANRTRAAFNRRFWFDAGPVSLRHRRWRGWRRPSLRPNQIFALALRHPVLDEACWQRSSISSPSAADAVWTANARARAPGLQGAVFGDLRARDAAYHQGRCGRGSLVPSSMRGFVCIRAEPRMRDRFLPRSTIILSDACMGTISEVFDASEPYAPRGCVAQAWSVARSPASLMNW